MPKNRCNLVYKSCVKWTFMPLFKLEFILILLNRGEQVFVVRVIYQKKKSKKKKGKNFTFFLYAKVLNMQSTFEIFLYFFTAIYVFNVLLMQSFNKFFKILAVKKSRSHSYMIYVKKYRFILIYYSNIKTNNSRDIFWWFNGDVQGSNSLSSNSQIIINKNPISSL